LKRISILANLTCNLPPLPVTYLYLEKLYQDSVDYFTALTNLKTLEYSVYHRPADSILRHTNFNVQPEKLRDRVPWLKTINFILELPTEDRDLGQDNEFDQAYRNAMYFYSLII